MRKKIENNIPEDLCDVSSVTLFPLSLELPVLLWEAVRNRHCPCLADIRFVPKDGRGRKKVPSIAHTRPRALSLSVSLSGVGVLLWKNYEKEGKVQTISK